jgi:acyl-phosphate glycerol 3-phosphate acyltransferase
MDPLLTALCTVVGSYLLGGIPFGYLVGRWRGIDIFQHGSGNIGATNVGRVLGRRFGILVFLLDFAKGAVPAGFALWLRQYSSSPERLPALIEGLPLWAGLASFLGHLFPIYLRFRGGKGVATGAGVVSVVMPVPALGAMLTWIALVCASRYVSLASLGAAAALCVFQLTLTPEPFSAANRITSSFCLAAAALVCYRHRANLARLLHGNENRLPENPAMFQLTKIIHVLALGLWFGSAAFFLLIVATTLFRTFDTLGTAAAERPAWFPVAKDFDKRDSHIDGPREQGSRVFGAAVTPLFPTFFLLQGICGLLATVTSLGWSRGRPESVTPAEQPRRTGRVHRWRSTLLLVALITVLAGWPLEHKVAELRIPRNETTDAYLRSPPESSAEALAAMQAARAEFGRWHLYSLGLGFATLLLVTAGMVLAARLPEAQ